MQRLLSDADLALGRLDGSIETLPDADIFVFMYVRKEAVLSSQIEGTQSSLDDVLAAEAKLLDPERPSDVREVLNYIAAMHLGLDRLKTLPLSSRLFREIHERLLRGVRGRHHEPGELRRTQNWIGPEGATLANAIYVPPPPDEAARAMADLDRFLHDESSPLPALIKFGLAHAQFETIHPFLEGNGRVGRLLITFLLCQKQILRRPVLYLSHYLKLHRQNYYDRLQAVRDAGAWEGWLKFFLKGVATVSHEASITAREIVALRERHRAQIVAEFGRAAGNGMRILEQLYRTPVVSVTDVRNLLKISSVGANHLVDRFVQAGLLREITGRKRNRAFRYGPYIDLFTEVRAS